MNYEQQQSLLENIQDIRLELNGGKSKRQQGVGITSKMYVDMQLVMLHDFIKSLASVEEELNYLQTERNKLNRQIAILKKQTLKQ